MCPHFILTLALKPNLNLLTLVGKTFFLFTQCNSGRTHTDRQYISYYLLYNSLLAFSFSWRLLVLLLLKHCLCIQPLFWSDSCSAWKLTVLLPLNISFSALDVCMCFFGRGGFYIGEVGYGWGWVPCTFCSCYKLRPAASWLLPLLSLSPSTVLSNQSTVRSSTEAPPTDRYETT